MKITGLKGSAQFRKFAADGKPLEFLRVNVIYGQNGTGKTTFSEFVDYDLNGAGERSIFSLEGEGTLHVFNRNYIENELRQFTFGKDGVASLAIGEDDVQKQSERSALEARILNYRNTLDDLRSRHEDIPKDTDTGRDAKESVLKLLDGIAGYNSTQYRNGAALTEKILNSKTTLSSEELSNYLMIARSEAPRTIQINLSPVAVGESDSQTLASLLETIPQVEGGRLNVDDYSLFSWIREGYKSHLAPDNESACICPFCGSTLEKERIGALRETFSSQKNSLIESCESLRDAFDAEKQTMRDDLRELSRVVSDLNSHSDQLSREINATIAALEIRIDWLTAATGILQRKISDVTQSGLIVEIADLPPLSYDRVLEAVQSYNQSVQDHGSRVVGAAKAVEASLLAPFRPILLENRANSARIERAIRAWQKRKARVEKELSELLSSISNKRRPAALMNLILQGTLGIEGFSVSITDDELSYVVTREGGELASHLSDGERQALALIYFLQTLDAEGVDPSGAVVFLDDPVLAVDDVRTNVLLHLLKQKSVGWSQVFLSTHDFGVFKKFVNLVSKDESEDVATFEAMKTSGGAVSIRRMPKRFLQFSGEYQYLFSKMIQGAFADSDEDLSLDSRNSARRLLEAFVEFQVPIANSSLRACIESAWGGIEQADALAPLMRGVMACLNDGSHAPSASASLDDWRPPTIAEIKSVYAIMLLLNRDHVNRMVEALYPVAENEALRNRVSGAAKRILGYQKAAANDSVPKFTDLTVILDGSDVVSVPVKDLEAAQE